MTADVTRKRALLFVFAFRSQPASSFAAFLSLHKNHVSKEKEDIIYFRNSNQLVIFFSEQTEAYDERRSVLVYRENTRAGTAAILTHFSPPHRLIS